MERLEALNIEEDLQPAERELLIEMLFHCERALAWTIKVKGMI